MRFGPPEQLAEPARRVRARLEPTWRVARRTVEQFFEDGGTQLAAAVSYFVLLSLFPLAIVAAAIGGLVVDDQEARAQVVDFLVENLPLASREGNDIEEVLRNVTAGSQAFGAIGVVALLFSASAVIGSLRNALNKVWQVEQRRSPLRGKAFDVLVAALAGLLVASSLILTVVSGVAVDLADGLGAIGRAIDAVLDSTAFLVPVALAAIVFAFLMRVVPARKLSMREIWPGLALATVGYELAKRGFTLYLEHFGRYDVIYGSIGAIVLFTVFVYLASIVFLLGAELTWVLRSGRRKAGV